MTSRRAHDADHGRAGPARRRRRRRRRRHRRGVEPTACPAGADGPGRGLAGSAGRRGGGMAGDRPGPDREQIAAMTPEQRQRLDRRIPPAGRQHRRCAVGHAGRRQPGQHRAGDRRRTPRRQPGVAGADRLLPRSARGGRRPGPQRPPRRSPDPRVRPRPGIADGAQRQPVDRQERRRHGPRAEHHDRGFGGEHQDRSAIRVGHPRRGRGHHLSGWSVPTR